VQTARDRILGERIARHGIAARPCRTVAAAAAVTCAIQAQDNGASRLGIRARATRVTESDVFGAIAAGEVTRSWLMRGTIHLVDTADLRWLVRLIGPNVQRRYRTRWRQLGLTDALLDRSIELLPELLDGRALTRHEIVAGLAERGLRVESDDPQYPTHLVVNAAAAGLVCRGIDRGRHSTFVLLDEWVPNAPDGPRGDDGLAELARRFFAAFSPATSADFTAWSGLGATRAIDLIRDELAVADVDGRAGFRLGETEPQRGVRLLPAFDNYLVGYRDREAILAGDLQSHVFSGGMIRPTLVIDGRITGVWSIRRAGETGHVTVRTFGPLRRTHQRALAAEVDDLARFLDRPVDLASVVEF
jgi:hypothetical protein